MTDDAFAEQARKLFARAEFVAGAPETAALPRSDLPEVAFAGRSNVGKSSLINALTGRKGLARVSNTPGRTREINFFRLGKTLMLVDLPGYGYARASRALSEQWQRAIFDYLKGRPNLRRVVLLIDARRGPMDVDREVMNLLDRAAVSCLAVLTKLDKLKAGEREAARAAIEAEAKKHVSCYPAVLATSSEKGLGLDDVRVHLATLAQEAGFGL